MLGSTQHRRRHTDRTAENRGSIERCEWCRDLGGAHWCWPGQPWEQYVVCDECARVAGLVSGVGSTAQKDVLAASSRPPTLGPSPGG